MSARRNAGSFCSGISWSESRVSGQDIMSFVSFPRLVVHLAWTFHAGSLTGMVGRCTGREAEVNRDAVGWNLGDCAKSSHGGSSVEACRGGSWWGKGKYSCWRKRKRPAVTYRSGKCSYAKNSWFRGRGVILRMAPWNLEFGPGKQKQSRRAAGRISIYHGLGGGNGWRYSSTRSEVSRGDNARADRL